MAEFGSLRAAGRHLGIAQPLITRSIREIEHELDASLFERHARGVRLTSIGKAFLRRAVIVQSELQRAREEVAQLKGGHTGQVSIALSAASSMAILPRMLSSFRARYPEALLKVTEGLFQTIEAEISAGEIDFYVGPFDQASSSSSQLTVEKIFDHRRFIVARRGHPLSEVRSISDLAEARWIRPALSTRRSEADFESILHEVGIVNPRIVMHTRSALATFISIINSDLLTVIPQQWLEFRPTADYLAMLNLTDFTGAAPVCIVRRSDLPLTPMAEFLSDLIRRAGGNYGRQIAVAAQHLSRSHGAPG